MSSTAETSNIKDMWMISKYTQSSEYLHCIWVILYCSQNKVAEIFTQDNAFKPLTWTFNAYSTSYLLKQNN